MGNTPESSERLLQVVFDLPQESVNWPPVSSERLWAAKTSTKFHLTVRNTPFYVKGIAHSDIILTRPDHQRREIVFERLVSESGHSALQIVIVRAPAKDDVELLLLNSGVTWELANSDTYIAADIKPECFYPPLRIALVAAQERGDIGIREGAISELHRAQLNSCGHLS